MPPEEIGGKKMNSDSELEKIIKGNAACDLILNGGSPRKVAIQYPLWFVENHEGVIRLWEVINQTSWRCNK